MAAAFLVALGLAYPDPSEARTPYRNYEPGMCLQIYAPAPCVALSVAGEPTRNPLLAKHSNASVAVDRLRKKACHRGLPWRDLAEDEVYCIQLAK
jgi:hypothetical protein